WADKGSKGDIYTLHARRSTDRGVTWSKTDLPHTTIHNATNVALAVANNGAVGFLYQQLSLGRWVTHLVQSHDGFMTSQDFVLAMPGGAVASEKGSEGHEKKRQSGAGGADEDFSGFLEQFIGSQFVACPVRVYERSGAASNEQFSCADIAIECRFLRHSKPACGHFVCRCAEIAADDCGARGFDREK